VGLVVSRLVEGLERLGRITVGRKVADEGIGIPKGVYYSALRGLVHK
jgi:hypothetical protein